METIRSNDIINLHMFIESWLKGTIEKTQDKFQYFEDVLHKDFMIIHPSGECQNRAEIISDFKSAYGIKGENFKIEIKDIVVRSMSENTCLMNYKEWQTDVDTQIRISTVVFKKLENSDNFNWFHLHETWHKC